MKETVSTSEGSGTAARQQEGSECRMIGVCEQGMAQGKDIICHSQKPCPFWDFSARSPTLPTSPYCGREDAVLAFLEQESGAP